MTEINVRQSGLNSSENDYLVEPKRIYSSGIVHEIVEHSPQMPQFDIHFTLLYFNIEGIGPLHHAQP